MGKTNKFNIKVAFFLSVATSLLFFSGFQIVSAHFFQTDGSVTTILHIDPNDDPVVGEPAFLSVSVDDTNNKFKAADCDCDIAISRDGAQLLNTPLSPIGSAPSIFEFKVPFIFGQKAIYHIAITGTPKTPGVFQKFATNYDLRVATEDLGNTNPSAAPAPSFLSQYRGIILVLLLDVVIIVLAVKEHSLEETKIDG